MDKPRIFLGSSGKQAKLLQALTRGLEDVARVEPWTSSFNPGTTTLERLLELTHEVDFAAFVFAQDDWTSASHPSALPSESGQASPRDNVVFEAGLFGGALGMRRTFILHANGAKLPSDLLGLTCIRYGDATTAAEMRAVNQKLRKAKDLAGGYTVVYQVDIRPGENAAEVLDNVIRVLKERIDPTAHQPLHVTPDGRQVQAQVRVLEHGRDGDVAAGETLPGACEIHASRLSGLPDPRLG